MKIGELSRRTGVSPSRIRFYERIGLLKMVDRRANGYRTYSVEAQVILEVIATAQRAGFSLDEIRKLLPTDDIAHWEHDALIETLRGKVADMEALEKRLAQNKAQLVSLIEDILAKPAGLDCAANARRVLSRMVEGDAESPPVTTSDVRRIGVAKSG